MDRLTTPVLALPIALAASVLGPRAEGALLASGSTEIAGGTSGLHSSVVLSCITSPDSGFFNTSTVEVAAGLDSTDGGAAYSATEPTSPDWSDFSSNLTNNIDSGFGWEVATTFGASAFMPLESVSFQGQTPVGQPDFAGYTIEEVRVQIVRVLIIQDPAGPGFTNYMVTFNWELHGVPTPGAGGVIGIAGAVLARRRR